MNFNFIIIIFLGGVSTQIFTKKKGVKK